MSTETRNEWGVGCFCERHHYCGKCLMENKGHTRILEDNPWCRYHGRVGPKDVVTMYPQGHDCDYTPKTH
jgi:hypothetical protein